MHANPPQFSATFSQIGKNGSTWHIRESGERRRRNGGVPIDVDHDGKISGDDLRSFYASLSISISGEDEDMIKAMIAVADANKDGFVQYEEFERVLKGRNKFGKEKEKCHGEAGAMVEDGDGRLGLDDLRTCLGRVELTVGDEEIEAMIQLGGGDETEGVSFEGLVSVLAVHDLVS
ncbi:hypothetical protein Cgig2_004568 [Carnegiea gigantea]|uniref:EF-hand domain-containing protein n=1 Tax=Carnegiea gigantea TaxID=171969 RepID=A0A9Q1GKA3_9CARY|nr:hypothetical protein Cgig2_004568 [Carnegiea gigantea]